MSEIVKLIITEEPIILKLNTTFVGGTIPLHGIDDSAYHEGIDGATEDHFLSADASGLPQDSGYNASDFATEAELEPRLLTAIQKTGLTDGGETALHLHDDQYLNKTNTTAYTPTADYHPATKAYADSSGVTAHDELTGLAADDHTQYAPLAGRPTVDFQASVDDAGFLTVTDSTGTVILTVDTVNGYTNHANISVPGAMLIRNGPAGIAVYRQLSCNNQIVRHVRQLTVGKDIPQVRNVEFADSSNPQLRLIQTDNTIYVDFQADASGNLVITPSGTQAEVAGGIKSEGVWLTPEGGYAVKYINNTGAATVKGEVVTPSASLDNAVEKIVVDIPNPIGVFYESGVADGSEAWVVTSGKADVYFVGNTTRAHLARGFITGDAGYVSGQALSEAIPTSPFSTDKHFYEIGHVLEARTGAGLAKCVLHFN